jgi:hypothetical protein
MAVGGRFWEGLRDLSPSSDAIDNGFSRYLTKPDLLFHRLQVSEGFLSSWLTKSRRGVAHEPATQIGFLYVANDDARTPCTEDLLRDVAACLVNRMDSLARTSRHIQNIAALWRVVKSRGARIRRKSSA